MRITTGIYKGKEIGSPKAIRPTQEKVRKALFDILGDVSGLRVLELFAGSGAVGIEALSRGAKEVIFVETNPLALKALRDNLSALRCSACHVWQCDASDAIKKLDRRAEKFDLIFLDPPYYKGLVPQRPQAFANARASAGLVTTGKRESLIPRPHPVAGSGSVAGLATIGKRESLAKKTLQSISVHAILPKNGLVVAQHFKKDNLPVLEGDLVLLTQRGYGDTQLSFYRKEGLFSGP